MMREKRSRWRVLALVMLWGITAAGLLGWARTQVSAQAAIYGVVDSDRIIAEYLTEELREPLEQAIAELQAEFDRESEGLPEEEKEQLFREYQARLEAIREALVRERIPLIRNAISEVAEAHQVAIV